MSFVLKMENEVYHVVLLVEDDVTAANKICEFINIKLQMKVICTKDLYEAKEMIKENLMIKYVITSYDVSKGRDEGVMFLSEYCEFIRPEIKVIAIGTIDKREVMVGEKKIFLQSEEDLNDSMVTMVTKKNR